jgi:uncharacterized membrane-anchored protein
MSNEQSFSELGSAVERFESSLHFFGNTLLVGSRVIFFVYIGSIFLFLEIAIQGNYGALRGVVSGIFVVTFFYLFFNIVFAVKENPTKDIRNSKLSYKIITSYFFQGWIMLNIASMFFSGDVNDALSFCTALFVGWAIITLFFIRKFSEKMNLVNQIWRD